MTDRKRSLGAAGQNDRLKKREQHMARTDHDEKVGSHTSGPGHFATIFVRCENAPAWPGPVPPAAPQCQPVPERPATAIRAIQPECHELTVKDHLRIQREIERRAYRYWRVGGGANNELNYWLQAEKELLAELVPARMPTGPKSQITKNSCL